MTWIDLGNPVPLEIPAIYRPYEWPKHPIKYLIKTPKRKFPDFETIIEKRRTRRSFGYLAVNELSEFLWLCSRVVAKGDSFLGFPITQRPTPSPGAIHPTHILICNDGNLWSRYVPEQHGLMSIGTLNEKLNGLWESISNVVVPESGSAILFLAEPGKIDAKYQFGASLIWRDSGVIMGHMALVSEALGLNFCPLGITGEPWAGKLVDCGLFVGVGVALIGSGSPY